MVFLGFVEECEDSSELRSEFFPCKAGGVPAWLDLRRCVPPEGLRCLRCASPMLFLLQLYSPMPEAEQDAFHRSLFLFCCPSSQCQAFSDRARCVRMQLPRHNDVYSADPVPGRGCAEVLCSPAPVPADALDSRVLPEWDICNEEEAAGEEEDPEREGEVSWEEAQRITERFEGVQLEEGDLEGLMAKEDACFREFQRRTRHEPDQVLRFVDVEERRQQPRGVQPLWVCESGQLGEAPPPPCDLCGEPRVLEFQVLPQLLHFLEVERQPGLADVDWGTIVVYTCRASCSLQRQGEGEGEGDRRLWAEEFAFVQNMHASGRAKEGGEGSSS